MRVLLTYSITRCCNLSRHERLKEKVRKMIQVFWINYLLQQYDPCFSFHCIKNCTIFLEKQSELLKLFLDLDLLQRPRSIFICMIYTQNFPSEYQLRAWKWSYNPLRDKEHFTKLPPLSTHFFSICRFFTYPKICCKTLKFYKIKSFNCYGKCKQIQTRVCKPRKY